jgi:O-antigen/teichoic acid export membrane protein
VSDIGDLARSESPLSARTSSRGVKVIALSLGNGLAMLGSIAFGVIAARYLTKGEYATYRQTFLVYDFVSPLLLMGIPTGLYYLLPRAGDDRKGTVIDAVALLTAAGVLFALAALAGGPLLAHQFDNPELTRTLPWLAAYAVFMLPVGAISAILVLAERVRELAIYTTLVSLITSLASITGVIASHHYELPVLAKVAAAGAAMPIGLVLMFRYFEGGYRPPSAASMKRMLRYSAPLGLAFMLGTITLKLDGIIVASLCTPEQFAIYVNGAMEIPLVGVIVGSITTVLFAEMANACAEGDKAKAIELFQSAAVQAGCILFPTLVYFALVAKPFILLLYSAEYSASVTPFLIYLAALPTRIVVYGAALMALGMSREVLIRSVFDLLFNALFCYAFVRLFGYNGAAVGLVVTLYCWTVPFNLHKIAHGYEVPQIRLLPWRDLTKVMAISLAAAPAAWIVLRFTVAQPDVLRLAASAAAFGIPFTIMLVRLGHVPLPPPLTAVLGRIPYLMPERR